jgi:hypothetical protein
LLAKAYSGGTGYLSQPVADSDTEDNAAIDELNKSFDKVLLTDKSDLSKITSPLLVWTLDDTVESSKTYRYRIRLGVFNPIAGTDKFVDENNPLRNKVILWTDFAEAPQTVEIPGRIHFFAKDIEEQAHRVTVTVCRYVLGNWYHYDFKVRPGETIGSAEKTVQPADETPNPLGKAYRTLGSESLTPKDVNYSTGAIVVDTVPVSDYGGTTNLYKRDFFEMFYSYRGDDLDSMPIGSKVWPVDKQRLYDNIKKLESQPKDTLRQWSEGKTGASQRTTEQQPGIPMGGMPTDRESYRQMMKSGTLGPK